MKKADTALSMGHFSCIGDQPDPNEDTRTHTIVHGLDPMAFAREDLLSEKMVYSVKGGNIQLETLTTKSSIYRIAHFSPDGEVTSASAKICEAIIKTFSCEEDLSPQRRLYYLHCLRRETEFMERMGPQVAPELYMSAPGYVVMSRLEEPGSQIFESLALQSKSTIRQYGLQCAQILAAQEQEQVIHADVKPSNILTTENGDVRFVDYGLAMTYEEADMLRRNSTNRFMGTLPYVSPEQLRASPGIKSDVFALGLMLSKLLSTTKRNVYEYWNCKRNGKFDLCAMASITQRSIDAYLREEIPDSDDLEILDGMLRFDEQARWTGAQASRGWDQLVSRDLSTGKKAGSEWLIGLVERQLVIPDSDTLALEHSPL